MLALYVQLYLQLTYLLYMYSYRPQIFALRPGKLLWLLDTVWMSAFLAFARFDPVLVC